MISTANHRTVFTEEICMTIACKISCSPTVWLKSIEATMCYKTACAAVKGWGLTWRSLVGLSWRFWMCWSFNLQRWSSTGNSSLQTDTCWHHQTRPGLHMQSLDTRHLKHKSKETSYVKVHSRQSYTVMNWKIKHYWETLVWPWESCNGRGSVVTASETWLTGQSSPQ